MDSHAPALLVARPGRLRDAWRALLVAAPHAWQVYEADDAPSALALLQAHQPRLVVLDVDLNGGEPWVLLQRIKASHPQCGLVAMVYNARQRAAALAAGADAILLRGFHAERLYQIIEQLLPQQDRAADTAGELLT